MTRSFFVFIVLSILMTSCKKEPEVISGCTDTLADNYNAQATEDNNSCTYVNRFVGSYSGNFECEGLFAFLFSMQDVNITQPTGDDSKVKIDVITPIQTLSVTGVINSPNTVTVEETIKDILVNPSDIVSGAEGDPVKTDLKIVTTMTISADNKTLTGQIEGTLTTKEPVVVGGFPFPAGFALNDVCKFVGTKK